MDELQILATVLASDEPSHDVVERSRYQLLNRIEGRPARWVRIKWWAVGLGLTAGVTAAAVVMVASSVAVPAPTVPRAVAMSAPQVLLAAAAAAESTPDSSGAYWHVTVIVRDPAAGSPPVVSEQWVTPDGRRWESWRGEIMEAPVRNPKPFVLAGDAVTVDELRSLPTDPEALKNRIGDAAERTTAVTSAGPLTPEDKARLAFESLIQLVSGLPAPPAVRAAAFRAIATYPEVTSLGAVPGGQGLQIDSEDRLVVDPATGMVNETTMFVSMDGGGWHFPDGATATIRAEWTDTVPE
jgi:hypothetical protein